MANYTHNVISFEGAVANSLESIAVALKGIKVAADAENRIQLMELKYKLLKDEGACRSQVMLADVNEALVNYK